MANYVHLGKRKRERSGNNGLSLKNNKNGKVSKCAFRRNFEFLEPLEITAYRLSKDLKILQTRISEIIKGKRRITADTALRLSKYFGNSAKFWLGIQNDYDIEEEKEKELNEIEHHGNKNLA